jgi:uncharacterized protein
MELAGEAWARIFDDRRAAKIVLPILALSGEDAEGEFADEELSPEVRAAILDRLPQSLQSIAAYWRNPGARLPGPEPVRSTKVGRNEPCPCGSGKKYKKCCGADRSLH